MWLLLAVLSCLGLLVIIYRAKRRNCHGLPGPRGLPFLGQALSVHPGRPYEKLLEWQKEFGDVFMVKLGSAIVVCLSDPELIREAYTKSFATDRVSAPLNSYFLADKGVIFSSGEIWQRTRRFTLFHLRNFGMGKSQIEDSIQTQISTFVNEVLRPNEGTPIVMDKTINIVVVNIVWDIISNEKFDIQDTRILDCMDRITKVSRMVDSYRILFMLFPFASGLWKEIPAVKAAFVEFRDILDKLFSASIQHHRENLQPDGEPRDYIDCFLLEQRKDPTMFSDDHLMRTLFDLFAAGSDTTSSTLKWAFCLLCTFPDVQSRVQEEIDLVVGRERPACFGDRLDMPYTEAFILETLRFADVVPMTVHVATCDFKLGNHLISKGTRLAALMRAVHQGPMMYSHPDRFIPDRFLDEQGKLKPNKALMPFSVGKRSCLGEALSRTELFLFITSIMQKFTIRFPTGFRHDFSYNKSRNIIREPSQFQIVPTSR